MSGGLNISTTDLRKIVDTSVRLLEVLDDDYDILTLRLQMLKDRALNEIKKRQ